MKIQSCENFTDKRQYQWKKIRRYFSAQFLPILNVVANNSYINAGIMSFYWIGVLDQVI